MGSVEGVGSVGKRQGVKNNGLGPRLGHTNCVCKKEAGPGGAECLPPPPLLLRLLTAACLPQLSPPPSLLSGYTDCTVAMVNTHYVYLPIPTIIQAPRRVNPKGRRWNRLMTGIQQPSLL